MAKKQKRRSISITGSAYRRLAVHCSRQGRSVSGWLEDMIAPHIEGIEDPGGPEYPTRRVPPDDEETEDLRKAAFGT